MYTLPETELMKIHATSDEGRKASFIIEPLSPGYGQTLGNALRRVLLSSLEGSAITAVRIDGVTHEFATLAGMKEDVVELILNLKTLRVKLLGDEPATVRLEAKGAGEVTAKNFEKNAQVEFADPDHYLATLDKQGKLSIEVLVERGRGYIPTEQRKDEQHPLGTITVDAIYTPVRKVHYEVDHTRVGGMTNFDKLSIDITTDGTVTAREALAQAAKVLVEHFGIVSQITEGDVEPTVKSEPEEIPAELIDDTQVEEVAEKKTAKKKSSAKSKK